MHCTLYSIPEIFGLKSVVKEKKFAMRGLVRFKALKTFRNVVIRDKFIDGLTYPNLTSGCVPI